MAPNEPPPAPDGKPFDAETYGKIAQLLPKERLTTHLASFGQQLRETAEGPVERERLKGSAHKLISQGGMLGLMELSYRARGLEEAFEGEAPLDSTFVAYRDSARRVLDQVVRLIEEL